ncbi:GNAT family acetyltransferase [Sphingomonas sp. RS2018]
MIDVATASDRAVVVALWHACGLTRPWNDPHADYDRALGGEASTILVVREGEAIIGSVMIGDDGHRGWVYYLATFPSARRRGIGRTLMAAAQDWLRSRGCPKIQLMVRDDNATAAAFYEAIGLERQKVATYGRFLEADG